MLFDLGLVEGVVSATGMSFTWDDNGNMVYWGDGVNTWNYTYDPENRLRRVTKNSALSAIYTYDADGRRIRSLDNASDVTDSPGRVRWRPH